MGFGSWHLSYVMHAARAGAPAPGGLHVPPPSATRQGEYTCAAAYPTAERSVRLGRQNLHMFRLRNTRFDIVGGILYFIFVVRSRRLLCRVAAVFMWL